MKTLILAFVLCFSFLAFGAEHTTRPGVQVVAVDESLNQFSVMWQKEISRRFPNAVAILCHGGSFQEGEWVVKAPYGEHQIMKATEIVKHYQALYPNRTIVLLACNPGHLKLGIPNVYYSHSSVWCVPDRQVMSNSEMQFMKLDGTLAPGSAQDRSDVDPDVVGNIWEFGTDDQN